MNEEIFELEDRFQPNLLGNDYAFVGPADANLMTNFIDVANRIAPVVAISRLIHHALSNRNAVRNALLTLPQNAELRIYVVISNGNPNLMHTTIKDYCRRNNINFNS